MHLADQKRWVAALVHQGYVTVEASAQPDPAALPVEDAEALGSLM